MRDFVTRESSCLGRKRVEKAIQVCYDEAYLKAGEEMKSSAMGKGRLMLLCSMVIFGTIGIFVRYIPLPSSLIANIRGLSGCAFLLLVLFAKKEKMEVAAIRRNLPVLMLSGTFLGANWIALFESYRYTTVATATLCYYMAPIIVMVLSPVLLKEKLTGKKIGIILAALFGMVLVTGVQTGGENQMLGIALGLLAAALYAGVILSNRKLKNIGTYDTTIMQLGGSALVLLPYNVMTTDFAGLQFNLPVLGLLALVGIVHTGVAYWLYFGSLKELSAQSAALLSYIDPITAIVLSALILGEAMTPVGILGAVIVLGATALDIKE